MINGKIYSIRTLTNENLIYIGSTKEPRLSARLSKHKSNCARPEETSDRLCRRSRSTFGEVSDAHHHHGAAAPYVLVRHCFFWVRTSAGDARIYHMQTLRSGKHRRPKPKDRAVAASPRYRAWRRQNWPARRRARRNGPPIEPWRTAIRALVPVRCAQRDVWSPAMATTVASFWPLLVPGLAQVHVVHGMSRDGRAPSTWRKKHQTPSRRFLEITPHRESGSTLQ